MTLLSTIVLNSLLSSVFSVKKGSLSLENEDGRILTALKLPVNLVASLLRSALMSSTWMLLPCPQCPRHLPKDDFYRFRSKGSASCPQCDCPLPHIEDIICSPHGLHQSSIDVIQAAAARKALASAGGGRFPTEIGAPPEAESADGTGAPLLTRRREDTSGSEAVALASDVATFDIEAAAPVTLASAGGGGGAPLDAEVAKRLGKMVHVVWPSTCAASVAMYCNLSSTKPGGVLYNLDMAFICGGALTSLVTCGYSFCWVDKNSPAAVAKKLRCAIGIMVFCMGISFMLRLFVTPSPSLKSDWYVFPVGFGVLAFVVYLAMQRKKLGGTQSEAASGTAERV